MTKQAILVGDTGAFEIERAAPAETREKPARTGSGRPNRPASAGAPGKKFRGNKSKPQGSKPQGSPAVAAKDSGSRDDARQDQGKRGRPQNRRRFHREARGRQAA